MRKVVAMCALQIGLVSNGVAQLQIGGHSNVWVQTYTEWDGMIDLNINATRFVPGVNIGYTCKGNGKTHLVPFVCVSPVRSFAIGKADSDVSSDPRRSKELNTYLSNIWTSGIRAERGVSDWLYGYGHIAFNYHKLSLRFSGADLRQTGTVKGIEAGLGARVRWASRVSSVHGLHYAYGRGSLLSAGSAHSATQDSDSTQVFEYDWVVRNTLIYTFA